MTIQQVIQSPRRRLPLVSSRAIRLRVFAENAVATYLNDAKNSEWRHRRADLLIDTVRAYTNDTPIPEDNDTTTLRTITRNVIQLYLEDAHTQLDVEKRADDLIAVIKVYLSREARGARS